MSEFRRDLMLGGAKMLAGPGVAGYGLITLNDIALLLGILCSAAILIHTTLKICWDWRDRAKERGRHRAPQDE